MKNIKIYARQVNPEIQDSDILNDEYYNDLIIKGNKDFYEHNTDLLDEIDDAAEDIYNFVYEFTENDCIAELSEANYEEIAEWLSEHYVTEKHNTWTAEELKRFISAYKERDNSRYNGYSLGSKSPENYTAIMLTIYIGEKWEYSTISGCCQSEWQTVYYPTEEYSEKDIGIFEVGYFNTGTEWEIHDDGYIPESVEDINGYSIYCYSYDPRKEIAEEFGVSPNDVIMYKCEM